MRYKVLRFRPGVFLCLLGLLLCGAVIFTGFPAKIIQTVSRQRKLPVYSVETDEKLIVLGINCAWGDEDVPGILKVLEERDVRASFFVTGSFCRKFPAAVKAMHDAGHEIGSHSNTHVDLTKLGHDEIIGQIRKANDEIEAVTGVRPALFRTPSGAYNDTVIEAIESEGMIPVQWSSDSIDYKDPTARQMQDRIMKNLRPGAITLFHAGAKNTPGALPQIIGAVQEKGYRFVTAGELIHPAPYTLNFEGRQSPAQS